MSLDRDSKTIQREDSRSKVADSLHSGRGGPSKDKRSMSMQSCITCWQSATHSSLHSMSLRSNDAGLCAKMALKSQTKCLTLEAPRNLEGGKQMRALMKSSGSRFPSHLQAMTTVDDIGSKVGVDGRIVDDCISTE
jgi:hypothetical protein